MSEVLEVNIQEDCPQARGVILKLTEYYCPNIHILFSGHHEGLFLPKPYRIGALLDLVINYGSQRDLSVIEFSSYSLDPIRKSFIGLKSGDVKLTDKEFDILFALYHAGQEGLSKADLLSCVWGYSQTLETHTLETHIYRLRQKIEADISDPSILITTDIGYALVFSVNT